MVSNTQKCDIGLKKPEEIKIMQREFDRECIERIKNIENIQVVLLEKINNLECKHNSIISDTVKEVYAKIGVDTNNPESVKTFVDNLRFNEMVHDGAKKSIIALLGAIAMLVVTWLWDAIIHGKT